MTIKKQTAAGEAIIEVRYNGCETISATLAGREIGSGLLPLGSPKTVGGKIIVATCGKLGLTADDVDAIDAALAVAKAAWWQSPAGITAKQESERWDRCCDRIAARRGDINNLLARHGQPKDNYERDKK